MKLQIGTDTKISDVQNKFAEEYPFLKVEFYKKKYSEMEVSAKKDRISPDIIISEQGKFIKADSIDINPERTVGTVEKEFYEKFDVVMQVSRKSGNIWIETSKTDDRTLKVQNQLGETMSSPQVDPIPEEEFEK